MSDVPPDVRELALGAVAIARRSGWTGKVTVSSEPGGYAVCIHVRRLSERELKRLARERRS